MMVAGTRIIGKPKYLPVVITLCLVSMFIFLLNNMQTVKIAKELDYNAGGGTAKQPGEYLKQLKTKKSGFSYCKLNFGLPTLLVYSEDNLSGTPELGKSSPFRILYDVIEGQVNEDEPGVTYVTHITKDFIPYLSEVVRYWEGPISVAAYLPDGDPKVILEEILHFCYCVPEMSRLSLHLVFKKDLQPSFYLSKLMPPPSCDIDNWSKSNSKQNITNSDNSSKIRNSKKGELVLDNWYPINVCRNAARAAAYTEYVLVCDVELMPSEGLASRFIDMTESYRCNSPDCHKRVFVVPVFEVESSEEVPRSKSQLVRLISVNKAVYFHQLSCAHCQRFPGLEQWKESNPGNIIRPLLETKREIPFDRWEPVYIGTKNEPMYFERLSWEGFQDKMIQMLEMCLAGYKLVILDGAFLVHWPGIKTATRKDESWRTPFVKKNQGYYDGLLRNISSKYRPNSQCGVK